MKTNPLHIGIGIGLAWALFILLALPELAHAEDGAVTLPGTTVQGDRETSVGLMIAPWKDEDASTIDRPPRFFDVPLQAINAADFQSNIEVREDFAAMRGH